MSQNVPDTVTVQSFGSGSSGNALLVRAGTTALLVDCGVGIRALRSGLAEHGLTPRDLTGVLITHEHRDHIQTLPRILHRGLPLLATRGTASAASLPPETTEIITAGRPVTVDGASVHALLVRHDATEPCGFHIEVAGARITVLTDLGCWQDHLVDAAASSDLVLLEANYNEMMLRHGPYPAHLKRRVASNKGHLGNDACGRAMAPVAKVSGDRTTWWLSHLSETNNSPRQAERDVREELYRAGTQAHVTALPRREAGPVWTFTPSARPAERRTPVLGGASGQLGLPGLD
jgi:phosphoribosyl 1,2-cyclic phosphodiesterase